MDTKELVRELRDDVLSADVDLAGPTATCRASTVTALCDAAEELERKMDLMHRGGTLAHMALDSALTQLTDEQNAHKLTAEALTKAIRDGDKAEQYRVERDKARAALKSGVNPVTGMFG